jgi:hypothetical protein
LAIAPDHRLFLPGGRIRFRLADYKTWGGPLRQNGPMAGGREPSAGNGVAELKQMMIDYKETSLAERAGATAE